MKASDPIGTIVPFSGGDLSIHSMEEKEVTVRNEHAHAVFLTKEGEHATMIVHFEDVQRCEMEIFLAPHSHCTFVCIDASSQPFAFTQGAQIGEDAHLRLLNVTLGTATEHMVESRVIGRNGVSSIDWLAYAKNTERQRLTVRNAFHEANGGGEVTMRGVAEQKASIDVRGLIEIGEHGGGTHTYLTQQVLMLDTTAKVDAQPALEIKTNDVKASHSATVSRVTPEDLYYFGARGIDPTVARGLFVQGFLGELVGRLELPEAETMLLEAIERKYATK